MNLFVGSIAPDVTDEELRQVFATYGQVTTVTIIKERESNRSRGFGFVEMPVKAEAMKAIDGLGGRCLLKGKVIMVKQARPKAEGHGGRRGGRRGW